jgi:hypothetical protein
LIKITGNKDATGGYAGLTLFKINFKNAANTFTSFFTNANSAARAYIFQDRDGTIADNTDLALKLNLAGGTLTGNLLFSTDNTLDIGATGATRPRDFLGRNAAIAGTLNVTGHVTVEGVTSTGAIGTGKFLFDTSPQVTTGFGIGVAATTGNSIKAAEGTAPAGVGSSDIIYPDSTAHRWKMNNNNGGADTVVGAATTDTFNNKTYDTAGSGNSFSINGVAATANTGTGSVARGTGPNLTNVTLNGGTAFNVYLEGSCTLAVAFGGASVGVTYTTQVCKYTQIGDLVTVDAAIILSSNGSSTGGLTLTGLPVAATSTSNRFQVLSVYSNTMTYTGTLLAYVDPTATTSVQFKVNSNGTATTPDNTNVNNTSILFINGTYKTN